MGLTRGKIERSLSLQDPETAGFAPLLQKNEVIPASDWPVACAADRESEIYKRKLQASYPHDAKWTYGVAALSQAKVDLGRGVHVARAGMLLTHYCGDQTFDNPKYAVPMLTLPFRRVRSRQECGVMLLPAWHHNFYHWIIDILPRLGLLDETSICAPLILPDTAKGFVRDTLTLLGRDFQTLGAGVHFFDSLYLPSAMSPTLDISRSKLSFLRNQVLPVMKRAASEPRGRRLYISRKDANIRRIRNESSLIDMLSARGFEVVTLSELSIADQVSTFADAEFIVGPHGAGFANLAFAREGTKFVEIFRKGHFSPSYYRIAQAIGCPYGVIVATPDGPDMEVNEEKLIELIDRMDAAAM